MNEDVIADLKQFIAAAVSQQTSDLIARMDQIEHRMATKDNLAALDKKLTDKIDDLQASVSEALSTSNDAVSDQLQDHERRIAKLEHLERTTA